MNVMPECNGIRTRALGAMADSPPPQPYYTYIIDSANHEKIAFETFACAIYTY